MSTFSDSSAHFMRVAEMSMPSRSRTKSRSSRTRSSTGMPITSSEAIDARRLRDRAAVAGEGDVGDLAVADAQLHLELVPAQRVGVLELEVGVLDLTPVMRVLVVVEDLLAVQVVHQGPSLGLEQAAGLDALGHVGGLLAVGGAVGELDHRQLALAGELLDLRPRALAVAVLDDLVGDARGVEAALDLPARVRPRAGTSTSSGAA